jgi:hypothetical protein
LADVLDDVSSADPSRRKTGIEMPVAQGIDHTLGGEVQKGPLEYIQDGKGRVVQIEFDSDY